MSRRKRFRRGWRRFMGWVGKIFGIVKDIDEYVDRKL